MARRQKARGGRPGAAGVNAVSAYAGTYRTWLALIGLIVAVVVSALAVIYSAYLYRHYFNEQQKLSEQRDALQVEWGQLLLEQSAWAAHGRLEREVGQKLNMKVPAATDILMVNP